MRGLYGLVLVAAWTALSWLWLIAFIVAIFNVEAAGQLLHVAANGSLLAALASFPMLYQAHTATA